MLTAAIDSVMTSEISKTLVCKWLDHNHYFIFIFYYIGVTVGRVGTVGVVGTIGWQHMEL